MDHRRLPTARRCRVGGDRAGRLGRRHASGPRPVGPVGGPRSRGESGGLRTGLRRPHGARRRLVAVRQGRSLRTRHPRHPRMVDGAAGPRTPAVLRRRLQLHRAGRDGPRRARRLQRGPVRPRPRRSGRRRRGQRRRALDRHPGPLRPVLPPPRTRRRVDDRRHPRARRAGHAPDRPLRARAPRVGLARPRPGARTQRERRAVARGAEPAAAHPRRRRRPQRRADDRSHAGRRAARPAREVDRRVGAHRARHDGEVARRGGPALRRRRGGPGGDRAGPAPDREGPAGARAGRGGRRRRRDVPRRHRLRLDRDPERRRAHPHRAVPQQRPGPGPG